jgi:hypothetical protein
MMSAIFTFFLTTGNAGAGKVVLQIIFMEDHPRLAAVGVHTLRAQSRPRAEYGEEQAGLLRAE